MSSNNSCTHEYFRNNSTFYKVLGFFYNANKNASELIPIVHFILILKCDY